MTISMDKKYRVEGFREVRVVSVDMHDPCGTPVWVAAKKNDAWLLLTFTSDGHNRPFGLQLTEVSPYDDFKIDEPVMVRDRDEESWVKRYFAGVSPEGTVLVFTSGGTSWSSRGETVFYLQCRRPTPEELAEQGVK